MSDWPPKPRSPQPSAQQGREWALIEKTVLAAVTEQKKARRWQIFFKALGFLYVGVLLIFLIKGCNSTSAEPVMSGSSQPHLAVVDVLGVIGTNEEVNSESLNKALTKAFEAEQSKAVVLNINSPGGSPVQSDEIWRKITKLKAEHEGKKVYAVIGDTGASGAYYIASAADEIWVNPSSLVGSIGVIMPNYGVSDLVKKLGITDRTMTAGEHKDLLSFTQPLDPFEVQHVQGVLNNVHAHFINAVQEGRGDKLVKPEENKLFSGLFWSGDQAVTLGLADKLGGLGDLQDTLGVDHQVNYTPVDPLKELFGSVGLTMQSALANGLSEGAKQLVSESAQTHHIE